MCDRLFDPICADLTDDQWADIENFDWYCAECQVRTFEQILATTYFYHKFLCLRQRDRKSYSHSLLYFLGMKMVDVVNNLKTQIFILLENGNCSNDTSIRYVMPLYTSI